MSTSSTWRCQSKTAWRLRAYPAIPAKRCPALFVLPPQLRHRGVQGTGPAVCFQAGFRERSAGGPGAGPCDFGKNGYPFYYGAALSELYPYSLQGHPLCPEDAAQRPDRHGTDRVISRTAVGIKELFSEIDDPRFIFTDRAFFCKPRLRPGAGWFLAGVEQRGPSPYQPPHDA